MKQYWQVRIIQLQSVFGLLISFYLYLFHEGVLIVGCTGSGWDDCGSVSGPFSPYSAIGPIPIAAIGFVGYLAIFMVIWLMDWDLVGQYLPELIIALTGLAFLFSLGLTGLELFVIHAFCRYCVISAINVTIMFVLAILYLRNPDSEEGASELDY